MKHMVVLVALSALLWTTAAAGQPVSQPESDAVRQSTDIQEVRPRVASLEYTIAVITLTGLGLLVSLGLLCLPPPSPER